MRSDRSLFRFYDSSDEGGGFVKTPRRRKALSSLPRRPVGRPDYRHESARRYALTKFRADGAWRNTTAPKGRCFSPQTMRRVIAELVGEGILEVKRSLDDGRIWIARRRDFKKYENPKKCGATSKSPAQNSTPFISPIGGSRREEYGREPAVTAKGDQIPKKLRKLAFAITKTGCSTLHQGNPYHLKSLQALHYDNCKVWFNSRTAWNYAQNALQDGFEAIRVHHAYAKALLHCHGLATDRGQKMSPALTVWLARQELAKDKRSRYERINIIRKREEAYRERVFSTLEQLQV